MPRRKSEPSNDIGRIIGVLIFLGGLAFAYYVTRAIPQLSQYSFQITIACFGIGVFVVVVAGLVALPIISRRRREAEAKQNQVNLLYRRLVDLSPTEFEKAMCELFAMNGFAVEHVGHRGDGGIDMRMEPKGMKYIAQCKRYEKNPVTVEQVREFYGALTDSGVDHGYFIPTSRFTKPATEWARYKPLTLVDGMKLKEQIAQHVAEGAGARDGQQAKPRQ